jgi:hypothetical protein
VAGALWRGLPGWTRTQGLTSDFPTLLDNVASALFIDAFGDVVRSLRVQPREQDVAEAPVLDLTVSEPAALEACPA